MKRKEREKKIKRKIFFANDCSEFVSACMYVYVYVCIYACTCLLICGYSRYFDDDDDDDDEEEEEEEEEEGNEAS